MKAVIAREVSALILKLAGPPAAAPGTHVRFDGSDSKPKIDLKSEGTSHGRYYGLITLNQITLTRKDQDVAGKMVELYFEVFREVLGDGKEDVQDGRDEGELGADGVEKVAGRVGKWQGRRKGAKGKPGKKGGEEELVETGEAKLVAAVLTGINRALPFATLDEAV
jgi:ribosome biogenesis protein MAK21